jgi:hypothetical protein
MSNNNKTKSDEIKAAGNDAAGFAANKIDIYQLYIEQMAKASASKYEPEVAELITKFNNIIESDKENTERGKLRKAVAKLKEAQACFSLNENKIYEGAPVDKIINGFAKWVSEHPTDERVKELSEYVVNAGEYKAKSKKTAKNVNFDAVKEAPKVEALLDHLKSKGADWSNGLNKKEILEKCGGAAIELDAGKVSTCVAALVKAGKSANEEAQNLIKRVGRKYFLPES